jgi:hypothetical protein
MTRASERSDGVKGRTEDFNRRDSCLVYFLKGHEEIIITESAIVVAV